MKMDRTVLTWRMGHAFLRGCQTEQVKRRGNCGGCSWCPFLFPPPVYWKRKPVAFSSNVSRHGVKKRAGTACATAQRGRRADKVNRRVIL